MPPREKESLEKAVIEDGGGINELYQALSNTNVQNAQASYENDRQYILGMIQNSVGYSILNNRANELLRSWMHGVLQQLLAAREETRDRSYADFCFQIGRVLWRNGENDAALLQYRKSLEIQEIVLGNDHPDTAATLNNIGLALEDKGDYCAALDHYQKALDVEIQVLGETHERTAISFSNIGSAQQATGNFEGALNNYKKSHAIKVSLLGSDHLSCATTNNNIG